MASILRPAWVSVPLSFAFISIDLTAWASCCLIFLFPASSVGPVVRMAVVRVSGEEMYVEKGDVVLNEALAG